MENVYIYENLTYKIDAIKEVICKSGVLAKINPTDKVLLKPNFVQESRTQDRDWEYVITHPIMISAVIELLCEVLKGKGEIILADAPMTGASWNKIVEHFPVHKWIELCEKNKVYFNMIDLRDEEWEMASNGIILNRRNLSGDPLGKVLVNLKKECSEFYNKPTTRQLLYGADYDINETNKAHNGIDNYYSVSRTVINADVFVNLAKMKTHKKAGITCCLKNLIGINTNKNLLPHHTIGTPREGGDQFESNSYGTVIESRMTMIAKKAIVRMKFLSPVLIPLKKLAILVWGDNKTKHRSGGWYGNDTLWRTILDLNKVMFYSDERGQLKVDERESRKRYIGIVDGIYAGQGNGPLEPDIIKAGVVICGTNAVAIDCAAAKIMGFDYKKIPQLSHAFLIKRYKLIDCSYNDIYCIYQNKVTSLSKLNYPNLQWKAAVGWDGHIE